MAETELYRTEKRARDEKGGSPRLGIASGRRDPEAGGPPFLVSRSFFRPVELGFCHTLCFVGDGQRSSGPYGRRVTMRRIRNFACAATLALSALGAAACSNKDSRVDDALNNDLSLAAQQRPGTPTDSISALEAGYANRAAAPAATPRAAAPAPARTVRRSTASSSSSGSSSGTYSSGTSSQPSTHQETVKHTQR